MFVYFKPGYTFLKCQNKKIYLAKSLYGQIFAEINLYNWKPFKETLAMTQILKIISNRIKLL